MIWKIVSLLGVTVGFLLLVLWVYWPSNKARIECYGKIPLEQAKHTHEVDGRHESEQKP